MHGLLDACVGFLETRLIHQLRLKNSFPPIFLVGAPRSGTTLVYQHLLNRFRFAFFPNLSKWYPRTCVGAAVLARFLGRPEPSYANRFGIMNGATAPSDGWDVFHRWFPRYDYSVPVDEANLHELRTIVWFLERVYGGPFANKNNSNSVRIQELSRLFPHALFIHVDRGLPETVDSLLRARKDNRVLPNEWWGAPPPVFVDRRFKDEMELTITQAWGLRQQIRRDLARLPQDRWMSIEYESFCVSPAVLEDWVQSRYTAHGIPLSDTGHSLPTSFTTRAGFRAGDPEFRQRVTAVVERLEAEPGWKTNG